MTIQGNLRAFLPGKKSPECGSLLARFLSEHPEVSPEQFFFPAMRFVRLASGEEPNAEAFSSSLTERISYKILVSAVQATETDSASVAHVRELSMLPAATKTAAIRCLLNFFPPYTPLPENAKTEAAALCKAAGLSDAETNALFTSDALERSRRESLLNSGAGLLAALVVLLLFVFAAIFLKTVFFGFLLAYLFLPLERFYEKWLFSSPFYAGLEKALAFPLIPLKKLKLALMKHRSAHSEKAETQETQRNKLTVKASALAILSLFCTGSALLLLIVALLTPFALKTGKNFGEWAKNTPLFKHAETAISKVLDAPPEGVPAKTDPAISQNDGAATQEEAPLRDRMKTGLRKLLADNAAGVAGAVMGKGGDLLEMFVSFAGSLGTFFFDLLLCVFFFFAFLQKMAFYTNASELRRNGQSVGAWMIGTVYGSDWFPVTNPKTREAAAEIIDRVCTMFNAWLRGYFWIIVIETIMYLTFFILFNVPYGIPLALVAGSTILLPFLGPLLSFCLTVAVTLAFSAHPAFSLFGICLAYGLINGLLEQLFLYPALIGEAIGLTTIETIIVVLLGGAVAGITGMIIAVPVAALLKYLIPRVYRSLPLFRRKPAPPSDALNREKTDLRED